jgi:hypothetical protein
VAIATHAQIRLLLVTYESLKRAQAQAVAADPRSGFVG